MSLIGEPFLSCHKKLDYEYQGNWGDQIVIYIRISSNLAIPRNDYKGARSHQTKCQTKNLIPSLEDDFLQINQPIREHVMTLKPLGQCVHFRKPDWRALQTI